MADNQQSNTSETPSELRALAEKRLKQKLLGSGVSSLNLNSSPEDLLKLIHELSVHQIEIEMQQDELFSSRLEIEDTLGRYAKLYDFAPASYVTLGRNGTILHTNLTASKLLGVDRSILYGMRIKQFVIPDDYRKIDALLVDVFAQKEPATVSVRLVAKDAQSPAPTLRSIRIDASKPDADDGCLVILSDVTEQKNAAVTLQRQAAALQTINECNQALLYSTLEFELLQKICDTIVTTGGYRSAWVGYTKHDKHKPVRPVAQAGYQGEHIKRAGISWSDVQFAQGPTGTAIQTAKVTTISDIQNNESYSPWRTEAMEQGYASVQALPLRQDNEVFGAITIYSAREQAFNTEETRLLSALADNIAYSISKIRLQEEKRQAEKALKEKQDLFTQTLESAHAGVWDRDLKSGENIWSNELWNLYGLTPGKEKASAKLWQSTIHPDDRQEILKIVNDAENHHNPIHIEYRILHPDGTVRWLMAKGIPIFDSKGEAVRTIGTCIDITDRKVIEHEHQRALARQTGLEALLKIKRIGFFELDLSNNTLYSTEQFAHIFGYDAPQESWNYAAMLNHILPEERLEVDRQFKEALPAKNNITIECRIRRHDGQTRWIWVAVGYQSDHEGHAGFMTGITRDITNRKLFIEENEQLQLHLQHSQKMQMVGQLAGGIAHDFNNMLTVILGHTELALERQDSSFRDLKAIEKAANHSAELTRQLLAFARRQSVTTQILDLNASVEEMLSMIRRIIGDHITLTWNPRIKYPMVKIAPSQVGQILTNLCVNARDAIESTGNILIETGDIHVGKTQSPAMHTCSIPGDYITLSVTDNGHGIDKKLLPHILEPFFTTKEAGKGTGMGLATVYGIVKQSNGFIDVESQKGKGTRISIYLPLKPQTAEPVIKGSTESTTRQGQETILLVEDEHDILHLCREELENNGYRVLAASTPLEAIALAKTNKERLTLLVTDVVMPEMNGSDLFSELEKISQTLKVIYMSAYTTDFITRHLGKSEGVSFIEKPFTMPTFIKTVTRILRK